MNDFLYSILLDNKKIATTKLEKADIPMGVVFGKINLLDITDGYDFFTDYCIKKIIGVTKYPENKLISTRHIPNLQVFDNDGIEIKGVATSIAGQGNNNFEITIEGLSHSILVSKFGHHIDRYEDSLGQSIGKDNIVEIGIDNKERLYIKPGEKKFSQIFRTATEVHWDNKESFLYSSKPKDWTYLDWYRQIIGVIEIECHCKLFLTDKTIWVNISNDLKKQIIGV